MAANCTSMFYFSFFFFVDYIKVHLNTRYICIYILYLHNLYVRYSEIYSVAYTIIKLLRFSNAFMLLGLNIVVLSIRTPPPGLTPTGQSSLIRCYAFTKLWNWWELIQAISHPSAIKAMGCNNCESTSVWGMETQHSVYPFLFALSGRLASAASVSKSCPCLWF